MGYTGGRHADPTYDDLFDHTESVEVDFDPTVIGYSDLLEVYWASQDPCSATYSRQYAKFLFYHGLEQKRLAEESKAALEAKLGRKVAAEVRPSDRFYRAEDYHQKYYLRQTTPLMREFARMYPDATQFTDSTAAARVNGFLGGHGGAGDLARVLPDLGLSEEAARSLQDQVSSRR